MHSDSDVSGVHSFLNSTGEGNSRKMLMSAGLQEIYFRMLLKMGKSLTESEFLQHFNAETFPKQIKFSATETREKENFWKPCKECLRSVGLLGVSQAA